MPSWPFFGFKKQNTKNIVSGKTCVTLELKSNLRQPDLQLEGY